MSAVRKAECQNIRGYARDPRLVDRCVLNGIFWFLRSGTPRRGLPKTNALLRESAGANAGSRRRRNISRRRAAVGDGVMKLLECQPDHG